MFRQVPSPDLIPALLVSLPEHVAQHVRDLAHAASLYGIQWRNSR
jgi:hypothetical protein